MVFGAGTASAFEGTSGGWYWQNPLVQGNSLNDVAVTATGAIAVGDAGVVFTSANGGVTWTRRISGMRSKLLAVDFVSATTGWAVGNGGVIKTTNGGVTWVAQDLPGLGTYRFTSVSFFDLNRGWACGSYSVDGVGTASRILRTIDGGTTWTIAKQWTSLGSKADVQRLMQVDFVSATNGWATGWGYDAGAGDWGYVVLKTGDAGVTWSITRFGDGKAEISAMDFTTTTDGWLATASLANYHPATIWKTTNGGGTWAAQTSKDGATITDLAASPAGDCYASGQTQGLPDWVGFVLHSSDAGATWTEEFSQATVKPEAVGFASTAAVAVGDGALFLSRDAGTGAWTQSSPGVRSNLTNVQFKDSNLGWAVGWKSTILRTTNGGRNWKATNVPSGISLEGIDMVTSKIGWAVGCSGPHVPYADLDAGYGTVILRTGDGGLNWKFQVDRTGSPGLAAVDFTDTKHGVAVGTSGLTARTTDGGATWWYSTIGSATLRDVQFTTAKIGVAVGGDTGSISGSGFIWRTANGGVKWTNPKPEPTPSAPLRSVKADSSGGLTVIGDNEQLYSSGDAGSSWSYAAIAFREVVQDPPYYHFMDVGLCDIPATSLVLADDVNGWALGEDGAIWTHNRAGSLPLWQLPPTISSFAPASGAVGTTVTLYGSGFVSAPGFQTTVNFQDGGAVPATVIADTQLTTVVPSGATLGKIAVTTSRGTGTSTQRFTVTSIAPVGSAARAAFATRAASGGPTVTGFLPTSGVAGGSVVISGTGFTGATDVTFALVPATFTVDSDSQIRATVPAGAKSGRIAVTTPSGRGESDTDFTVTIGTYRLDHAVASGQDNQLNSLAVVDWLDAWAVGARGTILSFDRLSPDTTFAPANGWLKTPLISLTATDAKSGVAWTRWVVDPPGAAGDPGNPGDWDGWAWTYGTAATFSTVGDQPGTRHLVYYQALDNVGNIELDPYWLRNGGTEVPRHVWVTVDTVGPQTYAPWPVSVARNARPAFTFWVNDDLSNKANVTIVIKNGADQTVKTLPLGWLATWHQFSAPISSWKCTLAKGAYTFSVQAEDQAGNKQALLGSNTFTVK
jgi:photosystem II stability/assembly factor-like uncharacterized protein